MRAILYLSRSPYVRSFWQVESVIESKADPQTISLTFWDGTTKDFTHVAKVEVVP
jgi:hypothetical protein